MGQQAGTWIIREGVHSFGGAMGLLGRLGARGGGYHVAGKVGTYLGTTSWNMIPALGRPRYATPIGYDKQGKATAWQNPYDNKGVFVNSINGNQDTFEKRGTGTPWTTGSVTVYATSGAFTTVLHRAGYDTKPGVTPSGYWLRNIQLVTPALTHWIGPGSQDHTGHIGILKIRLPEPHAVLLLAAGAGTLLVLQRANRRR